MHEQDYESHSSDRNEQLSDDAPDLLLDVPTLNVDEIELEIKNLRAHVSLSAELADLVKINVGVDAFLEEAKLGIKGIEAQVLLKVKLERVLGTLDRALEAIDNNPQILGGAVRRAAQAVEGGGQEGDQGTAQAAELARDIADQAGGATERAEGMLGREDEDAHEAEATNAARRKAQELGVRLSNVKGTGSGGLVLLKDVKEAAG